MCKFKSGIITKNGITLAPMYNDSHSSLLVSMGIEDNQMNAMKVFVRAELVPPNNDKTADVKSWKYRVDQDIVPDWYEEDSKRYEDEMREAVADWMEKHFITICGKSCMKIKEDEKGSYYMLTDALFESDFGKNNNYVTSNVRKKLQECDFANELRKEYSDKLVPITTNLLSLDGFDDYGVVDGDILAIPTIDLYRECRKNILNNNTWWWLATPDSTLSGGGSDGVQYVGSDGDVGYDWYNYCRAVRPFFILRNTSENQKCEQS